MRAMNHTLCALAGVLFGLALALPSLGREPETRPDRKPDAGTSVCAHRGASAAAPENNLAAFRLAGELGADGYELDTTLTVDGKLVVIHDGAVDRTTDGAGSVGKMTLAAIRQFDAGSWKDPRFKGERIPTLEEALKARGKQYVNVELKVNEHGAQRLAEAAVAAIRACKAEKSVLICSFSPEALEAVHRIAPKLRTGFLYSGKTPEKLPEGITMVHPQSATVTPEYMQWAKAKGYAVNAWTVDDPDEMRRLIALGVDMIITNVPDRLRALLDLNTNS
jgi:glycerophosphoryl diester phosphodiesterase